MTRLSDGELDDLRARNPIDLVAGQYVKLRRAGGRLVGPCPICGGRQLAQRFEIKADAWMCAVCEDGGDVISLVMKVEGCDFRGAIDKLGGRSTIDADRARQLFEARETKRVQREAEATNYREAERKRLWALWSAATPIHGTPAELYLAGRGCALPPVCPGLRFHPSMPYWHGEEENERGRKGPRCIHRGPAMVGAFIRTDGRFGGLHITWFEWRDGRWVKLELVDPDTGEMLPAKKMRGSKSGAHIAVTFNPTPRGMIMGEGIETVDTVYTAFVMKGRPIDDIAFSAAGDLGNMAGRATETLAHPVLKRPDGKPQRVPGPFPDMDDVGIAIPPSVEWLLLLGDGDSDPVLTDFAMQRAARRYARPGLEIRIAFAQVGLDFNNMMMVDQTND